VVVLGNIIVEMREGFSELSDVNDLISLLPKSAREGGPSTPVGLFEEYKNELESTALAVLPDSTHRETVAGQMAVAIKSSTHWAFKGFVPREEASIMYPLEKLDFVCELGGGKGGVSAVDREICAA
jgi:hypothetical protein